MYPPTGGVQTQGDPFEPVKIGILVDMDLGQLLADWLDPSILALEDAINEGVWARSPVALVTRDARGLPRENYRKVIEGYKWLVEQGCVVILGPLISDNCLTLQADGRRDRRARHRLDRRPPVRERLCFTVANGDIPTEGVMCANWLLPAGLPEGRAVLGGRILGPRLRRLLPRRRAAPRHDGHARGDARAQPARPQGAPRRHARHGHRGHLLRRLRLLHVPLRRRVHAPSTGTRPA